MNAAPQLDLLSWKPRGPFITEPDVKRLGRQLQAVFDYLHANRQWHFLQEIADATGEPAASVSARIRNINALWKAKKITEHIIKENLGRGLWRYVMVTN